MFVPSRRWLVLLTACALALPVGALRAAAIEPLPVQEIAPGVFVYAAPYALAARDNTGAIANLGFVVGRDAVAVVDTGGSLRAGERLRGAIRARTGLPIRYVVNTHVHPDHVLGNAAFADEGAVFVGHHSLPEALAARGPHYLAANQNLIGDGFRGTRIVPPTRLVEDRLDLDLGERRLRLEAWPTAHTNGDLTILDEATQTWFLGDLLFLGHVPALDGRLKGWLATLRALRERPVARVVPGHGPPAVSWPAAVQPIERYLARLEADVRGAIARGETLSEATRSAGGSEATNWALFDAFNARNATAAYQELEWE